MRLIKIDQLPEGAAPVPAKPKLTPIDKLPDGAQMIPTRRALMTAEKQVRADLRSMPVFAVDKDSKATEDEQRWLFDNQGILSDQELNDAKQTFEGNHPVQVGEGMMSGDAYYFDPKTSKPVPLAYGQKPPEGVQIGSAFGLDPGKDTPVTTFLKGTSNVFLEIGGLPFNLAEIGAGLVGFDENNWASKWNQEVQNTLDQWKFKMTPEAEAQLVDVKAFESAKDFFDSNNWSMTMDNVANLTGQVTGSMLQFLTAGGTLSKASKSGAAVSQSTQLAKAVAASSAISTSEALDAVQNVDGYTNQEKMWIAAMSATAIGALEVLVGGPEMKYMLGIEKSGARAAAQKVLIGEVLKDTGKAMTAETWQKAMAKAVPTMLDKMSGYGKEMAKISSKEAVEESAQTLAQKGIEQLADSVKNYTGEEGFGTQVLSPETYQELFVSALGGAIGGKLMGSVQYSSSHNIATHVLNGQEAALKNNVQHLVDSGRITQDHTNARINAYQRYRDELSAIEQGGEAIGKAAKKEVFRLTYEDEALGLKEKQIKENTSIPDALRDTQLEQIKGSRKRIREAINAVTQKQEAAPKPPQEQADPVTSEKANAASEAAKEPAPAAPSTTDVKVEKQEAASPVAEKEVIPKAEVVSDEQKTVIAQKLNEGQELTEQEAVVYQENIEQINDVAVEQHLAKQQEEISGVKQEDDFIQEVVERQKVEEVQEKTKAAEIEKKYPGYAEVESRLSKTMEQMTSEDAPEFKKFGAFLKIAKGTTYDRDVAFVHAVATNYVKSLSAAQSGVITKLFSDRGLSFTGERSKSDLQKAIVRIQRKRTSDNSSLSKGPDEVPAKDVKPAQTKKFMMSKDSEKELLMTHDPELAMAIMGRFKKLYPDVQVKYINEWYNKGSRILGAAVANTLYIDPNAAVQSTYFHEIAHMYWDALPDSDSVKSKLLEMFGGEESAILAIGRAGVQVAKEDSVEKSKMARFLNLLKNFWRKVKMIFGVRNQDDYVKVMAENIWNNEARISSKDFINATIKFMDAGGRLNEDTASKVISERMESIGMKTPLSKFKARDIYRFFTGQNRNDKFVEKNLDEISFQEKVHREYDVALKYFSSGSGKDKIKKIVPKSFPEYVNSQGRSIDGVSGEKYDREHDKYLSYKKNFYRIRKLWEELESYEHAYAMPVEQLQGMFNEILNYDEQANNVIMRYLSDVITTTRIAEQVSVENSDDWKKADYKLATVWLASYFEQNAEDLDNAVKNLLVSPTMIGDDFVGAQLHQRRKQKALFEYQQEIYFAKRRLEGRVKLIKKKNINLSKYFVDDQGNPVIFEKQGSVNKDVFLPSTTEIQKMIASTNENERIAGEFFKEYLGILLDNNINSDVMLNVPAVNADSWELKSRGYSIEKVFDLKAEMNTMLDEVVIKDKFGQFKSLGELKKELALSDQKGIVQKATAFNDLNKYTRQALKYLKRGVNADGTLIKKPGEYNIGKMMNFTHSDKTSRSWPEVFLTHVDNVVFIDHMQPLVPESVYWQNFYGKNQKDKMVEYLKLVDDHILFRKNPESALGYYWGNIAQAMISYTAYRFLSFNGIGAFFNALVGVSSTFRDVGIKPITKGAARLAKGIKFKDGALTSKGIELMKQFHVVETSIDTEINLPKRTIGKISAWLFSPITFVEYLNQSYSYLGLMDDKTWNAYGDQGQLLKKEDKITEDEHSRLILNVQSMNGAYHMFTKRPINYTPEGRLVTQFKNWLPDLVLSGTKAPAVDQNGDTRKGFLRTAFLDMFTDPAQRDRVKRLMKGDVTAWKQMPEIDKYNFLRLGRIIALSSVFALASAAADDDDKETKALMRRAIGDTLFLFDPEQWKFALATPPALKSFWDLVGLTSDFITLRSYQRNTAFGEKGELRAVSKLPAFIPVWGATERFIKTTANFAEERY